jgi:hypothetical protein
VSVTVEVTFKGNGRADVQEAMRPIGDPCICEQSTESPIYNSLFY